MNKYKVGQTITIKANECGHGYTIGSKVTIRSIAGAESYVGPGGWYFNDSEIRGCMLPINIKVL